jgi:uncharacterized protein
LRLAVRPEPPYVAPDVGRRLGGRGVSVHPTPACLRAAVQRGGLARAVRAPIPMTPEELMQLASQQYRRRAEGLLSSAHRAGRTAVGTDAVREAMAQRRLMLLVVAADASNRRQDMERQAERLGGSCAVLGTRASLGPLFHRDEVALVGITEPALAAEIAMAAHRARVLAGEDPGGEAITGSDPGVVLGRRGQIRAEDE